MRVFLHLGMLAVGVWGATLPPFDARSVLCILASVVHAAYLTLAGCIVFGDKL